MRVIGLLFPVLVVLCFALWAYQEHGLTRDVSTRVDELKSELGQTEDLLSFLEHEWAYLNRPDRLKELVNQHFAELRLSAVTHADFRMAESIPLRNAVELTIDRDSGMVLAAPRLTNLGR